jgi:SAM-dependent methyltransferase
MGPVLIPILQGLVTPPSSILDLCCGCGHFSAALSEVGYEVVGIDISEEMLRLARTNAPLVSFLNQDARNLRLINEATVCTFNSIAHFKDAELPALFSSIAANLSCRGVFMFDTYAAEAYASRWRGQYSVCLDDAFITVMSCYRHEQNMGENEIKIVDSRGIIDVHLTMHTHPKGLLCEALREAGFSSIEISDMGKDLGVEHEDDHLLFIASKGNRCVRL